MGDEGSEPTNVRDNEVIEHYTAGENEHNDGAGCSAGTENTASQSREQSVIPVRRRKRKRSPSQSSSSSDDDSDSSSDSEHRFEAVSSDNQFKWELPKGMAAYVNKHLQKYIPEKDLKESICNANPVPGNLNKPDPLDDYL